MNVNNKCPQYGINLVGPFRFDITGAECIKEKRELIVEKYEEKRRGLGSTVNLILYRNRTNCEEKNWGLEPMVDLILVRN